MTPVRTPDRSQSNFRQLTQERIYEEEYENAKSAGASHYDACEWASEQASAEFAEADLHEIEIRRTY